MIEYTDVNNLPDEIKVIDDYCIPEYNEFLEEKYVNSQKVPYAMVTSTSGGYEEDRDRPDKSHDFMASHLVLKPPYVFNESIFDFRPFFHVFSLAYRCKINVTMRYGDDNLPYDAHEDLVPEMIPDGSYRSAIYCVNGNNGATEIRNPNGEVYFVESKANRLISFPGPWTHCGWSATDVKFRCVVNFVYFGKAEYEAMDQLYEGQLQLADNGMMVLRNSV